MTRNEQIPSLNKFVIFDHTNGTYHLYNSELNWFVILENQISVEIIKLLNGTNTVLDITKKLQELYQNSSPEIIQNDVNNMIIDLHENQFLVIE